MIPITKLAAVAAFVVLVAAASVDHDERRATLRKALTQQGVACDTASLFRAVQEDQRPSVRLLAAELLTSLGEPATAPLLRARLQEESDHEVLAHLASDLLKLERAAAIPLAHVTLENLRDPANRLLVLGPLAELGDSSGYSEVAAGVRSSGGPIQRSAAFDLEAVVRKCRPCELIPAPIEMALSLLNAKDFSVRLSAAIGPRPFGRRSPGRDGAARNGDDGEKRKHQNLRDDGAALVGAQETTCWLLPMIASRMQPPGPWPIAKGRLFPFSYHQLALILAR